MHIRIKSIQIAERRIGRVSKTNACISAIQIGSRARGAVSGLKFQRSHVAPVVRFGEQRSARASNLAPSLGPAGTFRRAAQREGVEPSAWHACRRYT